MSSQVLLTLASPFPQADSPLRLLEPPDSCVHSLWSRLFAGDYHRPFIIDSGLRRSLHFSFDGVQSCMDLLDPDRLTLAYTRRMMAFLLFNSAPVRVLLLGLGGGSLAKFCYRCAHSCRSAAGREAAIDSSALRRPWPSSY